MGTHGRAMLRSASTEARATSDAYAQEESLNEREA